MKRGWRWKLLDSLGQPRALNAENLGAAAMQFGPLRGYKRCAGHEPFEARRLPGEIERNSPAGPSKPRALLEAGRRAAVGLKLGDVDIVGDPVRIAVESLAVADAGRLGEKLAVLGNQAVAAEDQIGCRFRR